MKKSLLLIASTFLCLQSFAQTKGHFSFSWTMFDEGETSARVVNLYSSTNVFSITSNEKEMGTERAVINRAEKKGVEFFSDVIDEESTDNYYSSFSWEESIEEAAYVSDIFSGVLGMPDFNVGLELLAEKSTIAGFPCQKFKITLPGNEGVVTGWIALGVHCLVVDDNFYLDTDEGMIMEMTMDFTDSNLVVKCTGYDAKFPEASPVYSLAIPEGYDSLDEMGGEENYSDEEGE